MTMNEVHGGAGQHTETPWGHSDAWQSGTESVELRAFLERVSLMPLLRATAAQLFELLAPASGERVLEVGCGVGVLLPRLAGLCGAAGQVVGLDRSAEFVHEARQRMRNRAGVKIDQGDAYALPYPGGSFDAAYCERVLMHLDEPSAALLEMRRVVRPGGRVVAAEPDWASIVIDHPDREAIGLLMHTANRSRRQPTIGRELNRHFAGAGFVNRVIKTVPIFSLDYADLCTYGLDLPWAVEELAHDRVLEESRGREIIEDLIAASSRGTFTAFGGYFIVRGFVPDQDGEDR